MTPPAIGRAEIRALNAAHHLDRVQDLFDRAADYWTLANGRPPDQATAAGYFAEGPPGYDPARSHHLGLSLDGHLVGVAELSFGFPEVDAAYLGLMILDPVWRGQGLGRLLLARAESLARAAHAPHLYLGVLQANPRGRAFWQAQGFAPTGLSGLDADTGHLLHRLVKKL